MKSDYICETYGLKFWNSEVGEIFGPSDGSKGRLAKCNVMVITKLNRRSRVDVGG